MFEFFLAETHPNGVIRKMSDFNTEIAQKWPEIDVSLS